jgi:hypothetical protein
VFIMRALYLLFSAVHNVGVHGMLLQEAADRERTELQVQLNTLHEQQLQLQETAAAKEVRCKGDCAG